LEEKRGFTKVEKSLYLLKKMIDGDRIGVGDSDVFEFLELDSKNKFESKIRSVNRAIEPIMKVFNSEDLELFRYDKEEKSYYLEL
jgi:hypothetical protein